MNKQIITKDIKRLFVSQDIRYKKDVLMGENRRDTKGKLQKIYHIKIKKILQEVEAYERLGYYVFYK